MDSGFKSLSVEVGFFIAILSVNQSGFLELYSRFQRPGFRIAQANFPGFWILDSTRKNFLDSRIRIPLYEANSTNKQ